MNDPHEQISGLTDRHKVIPIKSENVGYLERNIGYFWKNIFCFSFDFILEIPKFVAIPIRISGVFMGNTEAFIKR